MSIISIYLLKPVAHAEAALRGSEQHSNNTDLTFTSRTLNKLSWRWSACLWRVLVMGRELPRATPSTFLSSIVKVTQLLFKDYKLFTKVPQMCLIVCLCSAKASLCDITKGEKSNWPVYIILAQMENKHRRGSSKIFLNDQEVDFYMRGQHLLTLATKG